MDKVIFLDFDGVINNIGSREFITLPLVTASGKVWYGTYWASQCIAPFLKLMKWCNDNNISLVISSTWRIGQTTEVFNSYFDTYFRRENKVPRVVGLTDRDPNNDRGKEILDFVEKHNIKNYMVIDDDIDDIVELIADERVVKVNVNTGLVDKDVDKIQYMWYNNINKQQRSDVL